MCAWAERAVIIATTALMLAAAGMALAADARYGLGTPATAAEIAGWDIDVRPDGHGLPPGEGTAEQGEPLYANLCGDCHGDFGEGRGRFPALMGGAGTLAGENPVKSIGSFWPYATTIFDYLRRAQPFGHAQSLSDGQVYALTAYLLNLNDLVGFDEVVDADRLVAIRMPNRDGFINDTRADEAPGPPCMRACRGEVHETGAADHIDVTPGASEPDGQPALSATIVPPPMAGDPNRGKNLYVRCIACHSLSPGQHRAGPSLHGIIGRPAASVAGFGGYSAALQDSGVTWNEENLRRFLASPPGFVAGTTMPTPGLSDEGDLRDVLSYLQQVAQ